MRGFFRIQVRAVIGGAVGALVAALVAALAWSGALDGLEDLTVDYRLRLRKPQAVSEEVRLVGIGDRDVGSKLGRWPFPRAIHGDVLQILNASGAKHVAFDVLFTEPTDQDALLKKALEGQPNVTLAYHFENAEVTAKGLMTVGERAHFVKDASRYGLLMGDCALVAGRLPVAPFATLPVSYGAVNVVPDGDGVIRRVPLFFAHEGRLYPSLAMQTIITALGLTADQINIVPGKEVTLVDTSRGTLRIPVDEHGQYRINFLGDLSVFRPAFEYLDLYQAVNSKELEQHLKMAMHDSLAVVGLVSTGNTDVVSSSVGRIPGVAVQAMVMSNILTGNHLRFLPRWQEAMLLVMMGALLGISIWPARVGLGIAAFVMIVGIWCAIAMVAANANLILPVVPMLSTFGVATLALVGLEAVAMKQDRSRVVGALGRYIARPLLERLVAAEGVAPATSERRELTIFFSDIRGFTAWTERAEPDEVAARLNEYFAAMTPLVERHGGTLDKLIGDCIMVFFGAPAVMEDHAQQAVRMAQAMQREMARLNEAWSGRGYEPLNIGIGINTGYVTVGSFGSAAFLDYTVIGRAVNLAARIEESAPAGKILISARTQSLIGDAVRTELHGRMIFKGLPEPQRVYEVVAAA
ncbi:MAG: adenylate/guanylate cyclase domain-containing protein [Prosthecobacter sp.]|nr:adenylate/guanylate cyclase domain-containing protein [Prosthecobacter sp.]